MQARDLNPEPAPEVEAFDELGVDRTQIRAFLQLTPRERLRHLADFADFVWHVRRLNEKR